MKRLKQIAIAGLGLLVMGCSGGTPANGSSVQATPTPAAATNAAQPLDPMQDKGIGPVTELTLGPIDSDLAAKGGSIFKSNCSACHKMDKRRVGPPLRGVTTRRTPEWIMNMIINPSEMLEKNAQAKELLAEYATQMADQNLTEDEARAILEYLRTKETPDEK